MENTPSGLAQWVVDYQACRSWGQIKQSKAIKRNIDREIKRLGLARDDVYRVAQNMLTADHIRRAQT